MECTGKIHSVSRDWNTGKIILSFLLNEEPTEAINIISSFEKLRIKAKKFSKKRTLTANRYYWELLEQLAERVGTSKAFMHNKMLRKYGRTAKLGGKTIFVVIPDTEEAENDALESETYHIKPTSQVKEGKDGLMYRTYQMLRGSHEYNSQEMSALIDGLISECKEEGIETLPPKLLERMKASWRNQSS